MSKKKCNFAAKITFILILKFIHLWEELNYLLLHYLLL